LIDCVKLGGPLDRKPYRNLHLGTIEDKNEFRRRFDSLQLDVPTTITNSFNSEDNMLRVEHSTESATSTLNSDIQGVNAAGTAGDSSVSCIPPPVTTDAHIVYVVIWLLKLWRMLMFCCIFNLYRLIFLIRTSVTVLIGAFDSCIVLTLYNIANIVRSTHNI
jgi:hypothetical protein